MFSFRRPCRALVTTVAFGFVPAMEYGGHCYWVCAFGDVTVRGQTHV